MSTAPLHLDESAVARAFAPATIGNVGPGFDVLGMAVDGIGDTVTARFSTEPGLRVTRITGDDGKLPRDGATNTAAIAARHTLQRAGFDLGAMGLELELDKGMPIGSGLGSSAASAAASAFATNLLIGSPLRRHQLIEPCIEAEAAVSGRHADNVAPALLGGLILVRTLEPLDLVRLPIPNGLMAVVTTPRFELSTRAAREALPSSVPMSAMVRTAADLAAFVSACYAGDLGLMSRVVDDRIVNPPRLALIPGAPQVIEAALAAGALGSSISGAGPSIFALSRSRRSAESIGQAMVDAFGEAGLEATALISAADCPGARMV